MDDDTPELNKWATNLAERKAITDFIEWVQRRCEEEHPQLLVLDLHPDGLLDAYHGIDQAKLDRERRALLEQERQRQRRLAGGPR